MQDWRQGGHAGGASQRHKRQKGRHALAPRLGTSVQAPRWCACLGRWVSPQAAALAWNTSTGEGAPAHAWRRRSHEAHGRMVCCVWRVSAAWCVKSFTPAPGRAGRQARRASQGGRLHEGPTRSECRTGGREGVREARLSGRRGTKEDMLLRLVWAQVSKRQGGARAWAAGFPRKPQQWHCTPPRGRAHHTRGAVAATRASAACCAAYGVCLRRGAWLRPFPREGKEAGQALFTGRAPS